MLCHMFIPTGTVLGLERLAHHALAGAHRDLDTSIIVLMCLCHDVCLRQNNTMAMYVKTATGALHRIARCTVMSMILSSLPLSLYIYIYIYIYHIL